MHNAQCRMRNFYIYAKKNRAKTCFWRKNFVYLQYYSKSYRLQYCGSLISVIVFCELILEDVNLNSKVLNYDKVNDNQ